MDSPLLGLTLGMAVALDRLRRSAAAPAEGRGRSPRLPGGAFAAEARRGHLVGLSVWARWESLDSTDIAVVLALGLLSVLSSSSSRLLSSAARRAGHPRRVVGGGARRRRRTPPDLGRLMVVGCHAHVIVRGLGAEVEWVDGAQVVRLGGRDIRAATREFVDLERILREQDRAGVDVVVLCPWVNLCGIETARRTMRSRRWSTTASPRSGPSTSSGRTSSAR